MENATRQSAAGGRSGRGAARTLRRALGCMAAASALCVATMGLSGAAAETAMFRNFNLIDGQGGPAQGGSAMIVTDGRIVYVGSEAGAQVPAGVSAVDLGGAYVIPGMIDLHVHLGNVHGMVQDEHFYTRESVEADLATYAAYGFTTVATMGTDKDISFQIRKEQRASGRPDVARIYEAGQGIVFRTGYGGVPDLNRPVATPEEAVAEVDSQAAKGADFIKLWVDDELGTMPEMPSAISKAIIDTAHKHGLPAYAHIFYLKDAQRLVDQGIDGFVHSVRDQAIPPQLIAEMKRKNVAQVSATLSRERSLVAFGGPAREFTDPFFAQSISPETLAQLSSQERQRSVAGNPVYPRLDGFYEMAKSNLRRLADGGVNYGFGTDAGPVGRVPGYSGHWELELMVEDGFTPGQAIEAATGRAAAILGSRDIGVLERGRWADFVVLGANPLDNILNSRNIQSVYIAGRQVRSVTP